MIDLVSIILAAGWAVTSVTGSISYYYLVKFKSNTSADLDLTNFSIHKTLQSTKHSDIVIYKLIPQGSNPVKVINVYNLTTKRLQFQFIKPSNSVNNEINLYWHEEFALQDKEKKVQVASIYCASIGKGGYVELMKEEHPELMGGKKSVAHFILTKLKLKKPHTQIEAIDRIFQKQRTTNEKIYISSKLTTDQYEFKISELDKKKEQSKTIYRWIRSSGHLTKIRKFNKASLPIALIKNNNGIGDYIIEIDKSNIDICSALCTSLIFNLKK